MKEILDSGKGSRELRRRAHILLLPDESRPDGDHGDGEIAEVLEIGTATGGRARQRPFRPGPVLDIVVASTHQHMYNLVNKGFS